MGEMDGAKQGGGGTSVDDNDQMSDFVNSGRTGRRNAVPEVDTHGMDPDAVKLAERLSSMNTNTSDGYRENYSTDGATTSTSKALIRGDDLHYSRHETLRLSGNPT